MKPALFDLDQMALKGFAGTLLPVNVSLLTLYQAYKGYYHHLTVKFPGVGFCTGRRTIGSNQKLDPTSFPVLTMETFTASNSEHTSILFFFVCENKRINSTINCSAVCCWPGMDPGRPTTLPDINPLLQNYCLV